MRGSLRPETVLVSFCGTGAWCAGHIAKFVDYSSTCTGSHILINIIQHSRTPTKKPGLEGVGGVLEVSICRSWGNDQLGQWAGYSWQGMLSFFNSRHSLSHYYHFGIISTTSSKPEHIGSRPFLNFRPLRGLWKRGRRSMHSGTALAKVEHRTLLGTVHGFRNTLHTQHTYTISYNIEFRLGTQQLVG
jgi:hypothetical protein